MRRVGVAVMVVLLVMVVVGMQRGGSLRKTPFGVEDGVDSGAVGEDGKEEPAREGVFWW